MRVRFVLDGEGRRQEVRDHFDRLVLSFEYLDGLLKSANLPPTSVFARLSTLWSQPGRAPVPDIRSGTSGNLIL